MCGLTIAINVSQKKYRVSRRSLRFSLSPAQNHFSIATRDAVHYEEWSCLFFSSASRYPRAFENPSLAKIPLIILSPCYFVALLKTIFSWYACYLSLFLYSNIIIFSLFHRPHIKTLISDIIRLKEAHAMQLLPIFFLVTIRIANALKFYIQPWAIIAEMTVNRIIILYTQYPLFLLIPPSPALRSTFDVTDTMDNKTFRWIRIINNWCTRVLWTHEKYSTRFSKNCKTW